MRGSHAIAAWLLFRTPLLRATITCDTVTPTPTPTMEGSPMGLNRDNITTTPIEQMRNDIRAYFGSMAVEIDVDAFAQEAIKDYTEFCDIPAEQITAYGTDHDLAVDYLDTEDVGDPIVPAMHARALLGHMINSQQMHDIAVPSGTVRAVTLTVDQLGGLVAEILSEMSVSDHKVQRVIESYLSST